jgi:hypothetical protein
MLPRSGPWAIESGYRVPDRGRIPSDVRAAYDAAQ